MSGNLSERIPVSGLDHPFDKLAAIANSMLDEIEVLVTEMAGVGNEIAHDLRTPLTRVRIGLERGRANAKTLEELQSVADRAIGALDQSLTVITDHRDREQPRQSQPCRSRAGGPRAGGRGSLRPDRGRQARHVAGHVRG